MVNKNHLCENEAAAPNLHYTNKGPALPDLYSIVLYCIYV